MYQKERDMNRLIASVIGVALLAASTGLMIANAQQAQPPALIAGDRPVTAEQVLEKLQTDGWSNVVISRTGRYIESDRIHEWGDEQNGGRLANGSPSRRQ